MRVSICTCDRCGKEITDGVVYSLTVYAEDVHERCGLSVKAAMQNMTQNAALALNSKDLCEECKDDLTDGLFIV